MKSNAYRVNLDKPAAPEGVALVAAVPLESNAVVMARAVSLVRSRRLDAERIAADEENRRALDAEEARAAAARKLAGE